MTNRPGLRHTAEDAMARELTSRGGQGVPAYTILSDQEVKDPEASKAKLQAHNGYKVALVRALMQRTLSQLVA